MKRFIAVILVVAMLVTTGIGVFGASALTKDDMYNKFMTKSKISHHYVSGYIKNFLRSNDFTQDQLTKLDAVLDEFLALNLPDKGKSAHLYTHDEMAAVEALVAKACAIMNWTVKYELKANLVHKGDIVVKIFDASGKQIFEFDGDLVSKTGELPDDTMPWTAAMGIICLVASAGLAAAFVVSKKKSSSFAA